LLLRIWPAATFNSVWLLLSQICVCVLLFFRDDKYAIILGLCRKGPPAQQKSQSTRFSTEYSEERIN
jgi:hypothetical protein